jgi:ferrous iron transport protein B
MKVLLMGHPNVGKSVVFNRLTGANVIISNYPGTTVDYTKGYMKVKGKDFTVIDVPGTFSLEAKDKAEEVAVKMLEEEKDAVVICVVDSSKIERGLYLTLEIIERGYPVILALNMWDIAQDKSIHIDAEKLENILGIPVIPTIAINGKGIKDLVSKIKDATPVETDKILEKVGGKE